jgi:hypothetical protein
MTARIAASWALVAIPLAYGIIQTINKALPLFTGG